MIRKRLRWDRIFESKEDLQMLLGSNSSLVHKTFFGEYLFIQLENEVRAYSSICPHQKKKMNGAWVDGDSVVCPVHQYHYKLENGRGHGMCLEPFPLKFEEDGVYIGREKWSLF